MFLRPDDNRSFHDLMRDLARDERQESAHGVGPYVERDGVSSASVGPVRHVHFQELSPATDYLLAFDSEEEDGGIECFGTESHETLIEVAPVPEADPLPTFASEESGAGMKVDELSAVDTGDEPVSAGAFETSVQRGPAGRREVARYGFAVRRACGMAVASGRSRCRASYLAVCRLAKSLEGRRSKSIYAWRFAVGSFVCSLVVGGPAMFLLNQRAPSLMPRALRAGTPPPDLEERPVSPTTVRPTPMPPVPSTPSTAPIERTTTVVSRQTTRGTARAAEGRSPAKSPSISRQNEQTVGTAGRREPGPATVRSRPPSAAPRPVPVPRFRGSLAVRSSPRGAQVFLNGVSVGQAPLLLRDVPAGSRVLRVELEGYARWSASVRVVANQQTLATAELQPSSAQ